MTVYIEKPSLSLREELASLRNQGGHEERQFYFDGLVTNGTFDADTNWTKGTGWTIGSGKLLFSTGTQYAQAYQSLSAEKGRQYKVEYTVDSVSSGTFHIQILAGGIGSSVLASTNFVSTAGVKSLTFTSTVLNPTILFQANDAGLSLQIDNVSVFETDGTDVVHRMPKGWVPLHVYEDGLLQREGAANDYEVVYDGFDYYVKPAVAPSATTQTCVIGVRK